MTTTASPHTPDSAVDWVVGFIAELLDVSPDQIDPATELGLLGVDSATTLVICAKARDELGVPLRPKEVFDHFTADALAGHLAARLRAGV
ncbi:MULTISPECIES: acyl carrier protein [Actinomycetes]|uniref:Carrier domain-containing protein n=2 Tax=Actinomycetes TaxID=1760 RepID=A0ABP8SGM2_9ACTN|nr:acyl carrier protein [Streptomyces sp. CMSTAAHL-2]MCE3030169.1 acyl carrier protein [Streptomyces sp. CMSTAAHL-2]MYR00879.1 phosphopantetheine-binding protein [Streptomyces sp. SID6139]MYR24388.1 phosphopantetheine-binding protein [Streptomyces sp. SID6137]